MSAILEAGAESQAEVELSYHVPGASWRPLYDLTLDGEQLAVSYLAEVTQQTGEDWPAVELVLATTRRGQYQGLPELDPWYIGKAPARPPSMPRMTHRAMAFTAGSPVAAAGQAGAQADQPEAAVLMAEPGDAVGAGLVYRVQRPLAVPADGGLQLKCPSLGPGTITVHRQRCLIRLLRFRHSARPLQQGAESVGLRSWWGVALYLLIALPTIAVYAVWGWRRWEARRTRG